MLFPDLKAELSRHAGMRRIPARDTGMLALALLVSCGGGGGGDGNVGSDAVSLATLAQRLAPSPSTASDLAATTVRVSRRTLRIFRDSEAFDEVERFTRRLLPELFESSGDGDSINVDCRRNPFQFAPFLCYGELSFQANQRTSNGTVTATTIFNLRFDKFQVLTPDFERLRISGGLRLDYLTDVSGSPRRGTVRYESSGLSTNKDGEVLSATDGELTVSYGDGSTVVQTDRERLVDIGASSSSDEDGNITSGSVRANFQNGYVDFGWGEWPLRGGVPQVGARVTVTGADGTSASIRVTEVRGDGEVYEVTLTEAGVSETFDVFVPRQ